MLTKTGNQEAGLAEQVGEVNQLQQGGQGFFPARRLGPERCLCGAAVGAAQGIRRRHQLAEAAAADVLPDDPAVDLTASGVVRPA